MGTPAIPNAATANALAIADDASASVGVAFGGTPFGPSGDEGGNGSAYAQVNDTLHVFVSGATATTVTEISFTFTVDGSYGVTTASGESYGDIQPILLLGQGSFSEIISSGGATDYAPTVGTPGLSGWDSSSFSSNTPGLIVFNGTFSVTGQEQDVGVTEVLSAIAGEGTGLDFSNTAALSFDLPSNVSFTSASGVFDTTPVPEPASLTLLLAPLAAAAIRRRKTHPTN